MWALEGGPHCSQVHRAPPKWPSCPRSRVRSFSQPSAPLCSGHGDSEKMHAGREPVQFKPTLSVGSAVLDCGCKPDPVAWLTCLPALDPQCYSLAHNSHERPRAAAAPRLRLGSPLVLDLLAHRCISRLGQWPVETTRPPVRSQGPPTRPQGCCLPRATDS